MAVTVPASAPVESAEAVGSVVGVVIVAGREPFTAAVPLPARRKEVRQ